MRADARLFPPLIVHEEVRTNRSILVVVALPILGKKDLGKWASVLWPGILRGRGNRAPFRPARIASREVEAKSRLHRAARRCAPVAQRRDGAVKWELYEALIR